MNVRRMDRLVVAVRRVGLLILIVCCLVVPVVSILTNAFSAPDQGSMQNYCPDPTTPCELPPVIPTGRP